MFHDRNVFLDVIDWLRARGSAVSSLSGALTGDLFVLAAVPSLSSPLKVTIRYWNEMRQAAEIKQEMRQINSSVTVMLHGRLGDLSGLKPFCNSENVQAKSHRGVSLAANAPCSRPSFSRNLTGKSAISASRSRLRRVSLPLLKSCSAEAHLVLSAGCGFSDVPTTAIDADASRAKADSQQNRYSIASRQCDGVTSRISKRPRAPRGLVSHTLENVAARISIACGPETHSCGAAVGHKI